MKKPKDKKDKKEYGPPKEPGKCPWCGKDYEVRWSGIRCPDEDECGYWYCL